MMQSQESREPTWLAEEARSSRLLLSFVIIFFATALFANEADWYVSTYGSYSLSADDAETRVAQGNRWRQLSYMAIGTLGILLCAVPSRQRVAFLNIPVALLCMYAFVCIASITWTDTVWLTTKRLGIGIFGLLAMVGAAKHLSTRDVIDVALGIGAILLAVSLYAEISLGTFSPFASEYRFAGIVHPNTQGSACGLMVIAAFFGMKGSRRGKFIYFALLMLAGVLLVLTRSRTAFAACLCAVSAAWYLGASRNKQTLVGFAFPAAICACLLALLLLGVELSSSVTTAAQFGRGVESDLVTLNGRVPLWTSLIEHIGQRPLLGYGYQGFWSSDRIYEVSIEQEWTVPTAHSTFLDVLLNTGLFGAAIFCLGIVVTFRRVIRCCLETMSATDSFVFAALVYAFIVAIFESGFCQPNGFEPFIIGVALLHIMSRQPQSQTSDDVVCVRTATSRNWQPVSTEGLA